MNPRTPTATADLITSEDLRAEVTCRICDSQRLSPYLEGGTYRIVRCQDCGLRFVNPQPSIRELEDFYRNFDREKSWRGEGEEAFDRAIQRLIQGFAKGGSVLDIGSSKGNFLIAMRNAGLSTYGVEPSSKNSEFARAVNGIATYTGTVEDYLSTSVHQQFNVITLLNVVEHLREPKQVLLRLRDRVVDGGFMVVVVPDARFHAALGLTRRNLGFSDPFWMKKRLLVGFDPPQHLCSFEPRTITLLLQQCGFRKRLLRSAPVIFNPQAWRNVAKTLVYASSMLLYSMSLGRLVMGYSTVLIAQKDSLQ